MLDSVSLPHSVVHLFFHLLIRRYLLVLAMRIVRERNNRAQRDTATPIFQDMP